MGDVVRQLDLLVGGPGTWPCPPPPQHLQGVVPYWGQVIPASIFVGLLILIWMDSLTPLSNHLDRVVCPCTTAVTTLMIHILGDEEVSEVWILGA